MKINATYTLTIQSFRVVYHGIFDESLASVYTKEIQVTSVYNERAFHNTMQ